MEGKNKKVLIITYYWPPSGGSGVQRWLKFVKYLAVFGWEPYIFTPENPFFAIKDESLSEDVPSETEVIRFPIWEPYDLFFKLTGRSNKSAGKPLAVPSKNKSLLQRISIWIRGNLLVPDPRVFWVRPSAKFLGDFLKDNQISRIVTTGPPHSIHLIGLKLKEKDPSLRWIADFRDPWSEWGLLDSLGAGKWARNRHRKLEARVLSGADEVITITPFYVKQFEGLGKRKVHLLTNGYDEDDFKDIRYVRPSKFVIRHVGIINEKCDPRPFMLAVEELIRKNKSFARSVHIHFIGEVHPEFQHFVQQSQMLKGVTEFSGNIPHADLIEQYGSSSMLLFVLTGYKDAEGYMPGKLFEYLATGLPVLGIGPLEGDAAKLLTNTQAGEMVDGGDKESIQRILLENYNVWSSGDNVRMRKTGAFRYSRKEITEKLITIIS